MKLCFLVSALLPVAAISPNSSKATAVLREGANPNLQQDKDEKTEEV